jgi:hypothetical protein
MSTFRRLIGTAQKALDQQGPTRSRSGSGTDWRSLVRSAADSLTGEDTTRRDARDPAASRGTGVGIPTTSMPSLAEDRPARTTEGGAHAGARGAAADAAPRGAASLSAEDRRAIARYDYLVRTAEPEQLERVHREAFERLTPGQREQLSSRMGHELPEGERPRTDAPQDLARSATRLGVLDPRRLTRLLSRGDGEQAGRGAVGDHPSDARPSGERRSGGLGRTALGAGAVGLGAAGVGAAGGLLAAVAGGAVLSSVGGSLLEAAIGDGIDVDALAPDLGEQLAGFTEGFEGLEGVEGFEGLESSADWASGAADQAADGVGGGITDVGEQLSGFGDQLSDLGLGDLFGR